MPGRTKVWSGWLRGRCAGVVLRLPSAPAPSRMLLVEQEEEELGRVRSSKIQHGSCLQFPCRYKATAQGSADRSGGRTKCRRLVRGPALVRKRFAYVRCAWPPESVRSLCEDSHAAQRRQREAVRFLKCAGCCRSCRLGSGVSSLLGFLKLRSSCSGKWPGLSSWFHQLNAGFPVRSDASVEM